MPRISSREDFSLKLYKKATPNRLNDFQLREMDKECKPFIYSTEVKFFTGIKMAEGFNREEYLKFKKAISSDGAVIVTNFKSAEYDTQGHCISPADCNPIMYEQLDEDIRQWTFWRSSIRENSLRGLEDIEKTIDYAIPNNSSTS